MHTCTGHHRLIHITHTNALTQMHTHTQTHKCTQTQADTHTKTHTRTHIDMHTHMISTQTQHSSSAWQWIGNCIEEWSRALNDRVDFYHMQFNHTHTCTHMHAHTHKHINTHNHTETHFSYCTMATKLQQDENHHMGHAWNRTSFANF